MDEVLVCWIFLLFTALLRWAQQGSRGRKLQAWLHSSSEVVGLLTQWYTLMIAGLGFLLLRTFYDIVLFDYVRYHFLSPQFFMHGLNETIALQMKYDPVNYPNQQAVDAELQELSLNGPIKMVSLWSPVAGVIAAGVVVFTVFRIVTGSRAAWVEQVDTQREYYWALNQRMNMMIMVVLTPFVFIVMSMRATLRQWAVMTGSAYTRYLRQIHAGEAPDMTWEEVKNLELATYDADLELASFFQFTTIAAFGYLVGVFLSRSHYLGLDEEDAGEDAETVKNQYRHTLQWLSIQGLFAYVLVGATRSAISFTSTVLQEYKGMEALSSTLQVKGLDSTQAIFSFVTIFCVINMKFIGKMKDVRDNLGTNVDAKFMGTRLLLLVAQLQLKILAALTVGSAMYLKVVAAVDKLNNKYHHVDIDISHYTFSTNKAQLLHSSLLMIECLLVVVANAVLWKMGSKQLEGLLADKHFNKVFVTESSLGAPLVG